MIVLVSTYAAAGVAGATAVFALSRELMATKLTGWVRRVLDGLLVLMVVLSVGLAADAILAAA